VRRLLERVERATFADGSAAQVELWLDDTLVPADEVFAAMVVLQDSAGQWCVAWSPRRQEWSIPGGGREAGESVVGCAIREVREETGLELTADQLKPVGQERFSPLTEHGRWPSEGGSMQLYAARLAVASPPLVASEDDAVDPQWVSGAEFERRAGDRFWWPLVGSQLSR
jgi:8-oxo-dGTP pyrophosphatase MutT (NUDIX family)